MKNKLEQKYIASIRSSLPSSCPNKQTYIKDLSESVHSYCLEHSNLTIDRLQKTFGTPEEIAESFAQEQNGSVLIEQTKKTRTRRLLVIAATIIFVLIGICLLRTLLRSGHLRTEPSDMNTAIYTYEEDIALLDRSSIDLSDITMSFEQGNISSSEAEKIHAAKTISCLNNNGTLLWSARITTDFICPATVTPEVLSGLVQKEPQVSIDIMDESYTVEIKDTVYQNNLTQVTLLIHQDDFSQEKVIIFSCDENGNLK